MPTTKQIDIAKARVMKKRADQMGVKIQLQNFYALFHACRLLGCSDNCLVPNAPMWTIEFENKLIRVLSYYKSPQGCFVTPQDYENIERYDVVLHLNYVVASEDLELTVIDPVKLKEKATYVQQGWLHEGFQRPARADRWMFIPDQVSSDIPLSIS
jgi:hypothetical protein